MLGITMLFFLKKMRMLQWWQPQTSVLFKVHFFSFSIVWTSSFPLPLWAEYATSKVDVSGKTSSTSSGEQPLIALSHSGCWSRTLQPSETLTLKMFPPHLQNFFSWRIILSLLRFSKAMAPWDWGNQKRILTLQKDSLPYFWLFHILSGICFAMLFSAVESSHADVLFFHCGSFPFCFQ